MSGDGSEPLTPVPPVTPKTRRGQASRARLVEAASAAVVEHGVKGLRVDEVLAAAESSKSQLYHYFSDKDGLIDAVVAHRCAEFLGLLEAAFAAVSTLDALAATLEGFASEYATHLDGCPIGTLASELSTGPEPARRTVIEAFAAWEGLLESALQRIQANGDLGLEHDSGRLALGLLAGLEGGMFLSQVRGSDLPLRAALDGAMAHLKSLREDLD